MQEVSGVARGSNTKYLYEKLFWANWQLDYTTILQCVEGYGEYSIHIR